MKLFLKDGGNGRFSIFVSCEKCRKLIRQYRFYPSDKLTIKDTDKIKDNIKARMEKADYQYCYHCGNKNFGADTK